ncbi:hypothetical protein JCM10207_008907 [Rhodosporidiobolus poonsookiae]
MATTHNYPQDDLLSPNPPHPATDPSLVSPLIGATPSSHSQHPSRAPSPSTSQPNYYPAFDPQLSNPPPAGGASHLLPPPQPQQPASTSPLLDRPITPDQRGYAGHPQPNGGSLKVLQWTPQRGDEGTQVTVILDSLAIRAARPSAHSALQPSFGPGSPSLGGPSPQKGKDSPAAGGGASVNRRFVVVFGQAHAPTRFTRALTIDGNGVGQSMSAGQSEDDAFVVLTAFVPARQSMGPYGERVHVRVEVVDENGQVVESCGLGMWDEPLPATPTRVNALKRSGEELLSDREPPGTRSPARSVHNSPVRPQGEWQSPSLAHHGLSASTQSPMLGGPPPPQLHTPDDALPHLLGGGSAQPELVRTSQINAQKNGYGATYSHKVVLKLQGDLNTMAMGWSNDEWTCRRRLIQFWPQQEGNVINVAFRPIAQSEYVQNSIVISCIFRDEWNECFVTSVDTIYLLEALVGSRFTVEEKNRIRRNLEGFKPMTVSKSKPDAEAFFKLIMSFPNPKPRNIEKDVKVFPWKILAQALKKIMNKYSANYPLGPDGAPLSNPHPSAAAPLDPSASTSGPSSSQPSHLSAPPPQSPHLAHSHSPHLAHSQAHQQSPHLPAPPHPHSVHASPHLVHASPHLGHTASPHLGGPQGGNGAAYPHSPVPQGDLRSPALGHGQWGPPPPSSEAYGPPQGGYGGGYSGGQGGGSHNLFPSAEDYGVSSSAAAGAQGQGGMNHLRSFSEGVQVQSPHLGTGSPHTMGHHAPQQGYAHGLHGHQAHVQYGTPHLGGPTGPGSTYASPAVGQKAWGDEAGAGEGEQ